MKEIRPRALIKALSLSTLKLSKGNGGRRRISPISSTSNVCSQTSSGAEVSASAFANMGVEAEVAFRMRTKLVGPGVTAATAALAVEGAAPALELLDFLFAQTRAARARVNLRKPDIFVDVAAVGVCYDVNREDWTALRGARHG